MSRIGKLEKRGDEVYINVEDGRLSDEGYPIRLSDDIRERLHGELIEGWEAIDENNEVIASRKPAIKAKIDELLE